MDVYLECAVNSAHVSLLHVFCAAGLQRACGTARISWKEGTSGRCPNTHIVIIFVIFIQVL